jgi:mercuric ion binding protein
VIAVLNRFHSQKAMLSTAALILAAGAAIVVNHSAPLFGQPRVPTAAEKNAANATVTLTIDGMTCAACAKGLAATLRKAPGVISSQVDYGKKEATLIYDPAKQSAESFKKIVRQSGYTCK